MVVKEKKTELAMVHILHAVFLLGTWFIPKIMEVMSDTVVFEKFKGSLVSQCFLGKYTLLN